MDELIIFKLSSSFSLLHSKFSAIVQFLGNFLHDLPEKFCFSFVIRHIANSFPCESDQSIDLRDQVPFSGIGAACQFHEEQYQHFLFAILFCPMQNVLQIILSELRISLEKLDQLSFQGSCE